MRQWSRQNKIEISFDLLNSDYAHELEMYKINEKIHLTSLIFLTVKLILLGKRNLNFFGI